MDRFKLVCGDRLHRRIGIEAPLRDRLLDSSLGARRTVNATGPPTSPAPFGTSPRLPLGHATSDSLALPER